MTQRRQRALALLASLLVLCALTACGSSSDDRSVPIPEQKAQPATFWVRGSFSTGTGTEADPEATFAKLSPETSMLSTPFTFPAHSGVIGVTGDKAWEGGNPIVAWDLGTAKEESQLPIPPLPGYRVEAKRVQRIGERTVASVRAIPDQPDTPEMVVLFGIEGSGLTELARYTHRDSDFRLIGSGANPWSMTLDGDRITVSKLDPSLKLVTQTKPLDVTRYAGSVAEAAWFTGDDPAVATRLDLVTGDVQTVALPAGVTQLITGKNLWALSCAARSTPGCSSSEASLQVLQRLDPASGAVLERLELTVPGLYARDETGPVDIGGYIVGVTRMTESTPYRFRPAVIDLGKLAKPDSASQAFSTPQRAVSQIYLPWPTPFE